VDRALEWESPLCPNIDSTITVSSSTSLDMSVVVIPSPSLSSEFIPNAVANSLYTNKSSS